jgi:hypothetical protein
MSGKRHTQFQPLAYPVFDRALQQHVCYPHKPPPVLQSRLFLVRTKELDLANDDVQRQKCAGRKTNIYLAQSKQTFRLVQQNNSALSPHTT